MSYIKSRARVIAAFIAFAGACAVVFALYDVRVEAVMYAGAICLALALVFGIADYIRFRKKRSALLRLKDEVTDSIDNLPAPDNDIERCYAALCEELFAALCEMKSENAHRMSNMSDYYTMWAHQIKMPIAAMRLVLDNEDSPRSRELSEELQRIEQYTQMVLCYVRLESSENDIVVRMHSLDDMIKQAIRRFSSQFIRKKLALSYESTDVKVLTDEKWFVFVLEQLLSNAVKYTRKGRVSIEVKDGELCISDTGIGIASEDLPRIFDKGFTGFNGRVDMKASGIGLYLCKRVCEMLGHTISITSSSSGTCAKIALERTEVDFRE